MANQSYQIVILGGGTAGIMSAAQLLKKNANLKLAIIEPSSKHFYQPAYTLVGAGTYSLQDCIREEKDFIPKGATWIQDYAVQIDAKQKEVHLKNGSKVQYEVLIIATGIVYDLDKIEGLREALDKGIACSNYIDPNKTWELLQKFKGGNAIYTQPNTPIKCGGAPQKAAYLGADYLRKKGLLQKSNIVLAMPGSVIFGVKIIAETLMQKVQEYGIHLMLGAAPVSIDPQYKIIKFQNVLSTENQCFISHDPKLSAKSFSNHEIEIPFDFLHLAPPQTTHSFLKESGLTNQQGWVDVNINSLQHNRYPDIFALGDAAALPTAKTGAAIRKQVPVLVDNVLNFINGKPVSNFSYEGYSSCPLVTGYNEMVLAEFNYKNEFTPDPKLKYMLVFNSHKPDFRLWILKKYILPYLYWNQMLRGVEI